jgi:hypothetical protein
MKVSVEIVSMYATSRISMWQDESGDGDYVGKQIGFQCGKMKKSAVTDAPQATYLLQEKRARWSCRVP